jgi:hypothetical protein
MGYRQQSQRALLLAAVLGLTHAIALPEPTAAPARVEARAPIITPAAIRFDSRHSYLQQRDIFDQIKSGVDGIAHSWASVLGTDLPSFFTDGTSLHFGRACRHPSFRAGRWAKLVLTRHVIRHSRLVRGPPHGLPGSLEPQHRRQRPGC